MGGEARKREQMGPDDAWEEGRAKREQHKMTGAAAKYTHQHCQRKRYIADTSSGIFDGCHIRRIHIGGREESRAAMGPDCDDLEARRDVVACGGCCGDATDVVQGLVSRLASTAANEEGHSPVVGKDIDQGAADDSCDCAWKQ